MFFCGLFTTTTFYFLLNWQHLLWKSNKLLKYSPALAILFCKSDNSFFYHRGRLSYGKNKWSTFAIGFMSILYKENIIRYQKPL